MLTNHHLLLWAPTPQIDIRGEEGDNGKAKNSSIYIRKHNVQSETNRHAHGKGKGNVQSEETPDINIGPFT